jgi:hypothetical protein
MLFYKTALPYSTLRDDGIIDYVILRMKIQKIMNTLHIPLERLPSQTTLDLKRSTEQLMYPYS